MKTTQFTDGMFCYWTAIVGLQLLTFSLIPFGSIRGLVVYLAVIFLTAPILFSLAFPQTFWAFLKYHVIAWVVFIGLGVLGLVGWHYY